VLVQQVDVVGAQALEAALHRRADVLGWLLVPAPRWPVTASTLKPNLVAMTTCSRTGASASPSNSSLLHGP
jgi:hypothetical protein